MCLIIYFFFVYIFQLERSFQRFTTFYNNRHSGRKLYWLYQMSKGELVTNCFKNRYTLQVGTYTALLVASDYQSKDLGVRSFVWTFTFFSVIKRCPLPSFQVFFMSMEIEIELNSAEWRNSVNSTMSFAYTCLLHHYDKEQMSFLVY